MPTIIDPKGREIELTTRQKNIMFHKAKELREEVRSSLLTKSQLWNPSDHNVKEHIRREGNSKMVDKANLYRKTMQAIGADPSDVSIERLRKGR